MVARSTARELVGFALDALPTLQLSSGLFCFDRDFSSTALRGESVRYSLMVLIGLLRARAAGYEVPVDPEELLGRCIARREQFSPGDLGLALWAADRSEPARRAGLVDEIEQQTSTPGVLEHLVGMEVAWLVIGLAIAAQGEPIAEKPLERILSHLSLRRARSGLYYHDASSRYRRQLPNFATQIYTLLALVSVARLEHDNGASAAARQLGDQLLRCQQPDGGWPWLFEADRGFVVEPYEIYTVHQDAMAPMALLELSDLTQDPRYRASAVRGLEWSRGENPLDVDLIVPEAQFAHRSIRRRKPWDRAALFTSSACAVLAHRPVHLPGFALEINATCRPYHLGWILEAWAGREDAMQEGA
jgi:hypothetical protein